MARYRDNPELTLAWAAIDTGGWRAGNLIGHLREVVGRLGEQMSSQPASRLNPAQALSVSELPMLGTATSFRQAVSAEGIWGRRVLVTGAGGSIGSELVKQISKLAPKRLCLVDSCEFNLYQVSYALERERPVKNWSACICDIRDEIAMRHLFLRESPEIVFHAAALKHVPLLEEHNVVEAVLTNVLGTKIVMDLCASTGADFIAISTDKAVNPSSQMGLTKRVAEIYIHDRALRHPDARVSLVRFGNVVGSSGSVVPLFRKQIEAGGPVTVTHPDMTRYLMTIEDAVRLTLAAASLPQAGFALYVLEMGNPVRIFDLAVEMIRTRGEAAIRRYRRHLRGRPSGRETSRRAELCLGAPVSDDGDGGAVGVA